MGFDLDLQTDAYLASFIDPSNFNAINLVWNHKNEFLSFRTYYRLNIPSCFCNDRLLYQWYVLKLLNISHKLFQLLHLEDGEKWLRLTAHRTQSTVRLIRWLIYCSEKNVYFNFYLLSTKRRKDVSLVAILFSVIKLWLNFLQIKQTWKCLPFIIGNFRRKYYTFSLSLSVLVYLTPQPTVSQ